MATTLHKAQTYNRFPGRFTTPILVIVSIISITLLSIAQPLPLPLLHAENLHEPDEDVDEV